MNCRTTHHLACECREHKIAVLTKVALDAICELDVLKNIAPIKPEHRDYIRAMVERGHDAAEAVGLIIPMPVADRYAREEETHA